jgi:response regulator RpfG family c-di-GMP phosphodiesterase
LDRKCNPLENGGRLKITDNLMNSPGSKREANLAALRASRLNQQAKAPYTDGNTSESFKGERWDGSGEKFMIYSPLLGPGMYLNQ